MMVDVGEGEVVTTEEGVAKANENGSPGNDGWNDGLFG